LRTGCGLDPTSIISSIGSSIVLSIVLGMTGTNPDQDYKVRENRARRAAKRQGLELVKNRLRDPRALDYGTYGLIDAFTHERVAGNERTGFGLSLDDIEAELDRGRHR
jgi:hypothetical protein